MDTAAKRKDLEDEQNAIEMWLRSPLGAEARRRENEQRSALATAILTNDVRSVEDLFVLLQAKGHYNALADWRQPSEARLEEIRAELSSLPED